MRKCGVKEVVVARCSERIERVAKGLAGVTS
jgi:hypothetical protein